MTSDQDTDIFDDPDNFKLSQVVHPSQLSICMASEEDTKAVAELKLCPNFEYEDDYEDGFGYPIICNACWAVGFKSVCEKALKEE